MPAAMILVARIFTRGVGVVLLLTFLSLWAQADILMGPEGLSPVGDSLRPGIAFMRRPSLLWLADGMDTIHLVHLLGVLASVLLIVGKWRRVGVAGAMIAYLSLIHAGGPFFQFQWDNLVMETLWLCLLLPNDERDEPHVLVGWAFRALLFRMYLESGLVKILWGTESWGQWIAMDRYYETAPIPLRMGWLFHQLPHGFHVVEQAGTYFVEGLLPIVFLSPRRIRRWAFPPAFLLQAFIALTASYGSFNFLSALLCLWLLDDATLRRKDVPASTENRGRVGPVLAGVLIALGVPPAVNLVAPSETLVRVEHALNPWHFTHAYHLFANVTLTRPAVFVQSSDDGEHWETHFMRYAPGPLDRGPPIALAPHHPRVDFQMWFFGLSPRPEAWHRRLLASMCNARSPVRDVFVNPPAAVPAMVRFVLVEDHMTDIATLRSTGAWWTRSEERPFLVAQCR